MTVWQNFQTVQQFMTNTKGLSCKEKCNGCETKWPKTGTTHVHRGVDKKGKVWYFCDKCAELATSLKADLAT